MSSATKALNLLSHFSTERPEIGLSQLCRLAHRDKATTYRHLQALEMVGFVEQNHQTKQYRLGPALMNLAQVREATVPRKASARAALETLADATGETAHVTVLSGTTVYALDDCESAHHGTRAIVDITEFPLHATASGFIALAFGPKDLLGVALANMTKFTETTPTAKNDLQEIVATVRETGFSRANQSFEAEIYGMAAPLFDHTGGLAGAISVATVASRLTENLEEIIQSELISAAREISRNWGGTIPTQIEAAWAKSHTHKHALETTP